MKKILGIFLVMVCLAGCNKEPEELKINNSDKLSGFWSEGVYQDTVWIYKRVNTLSENNYGFGFKANSEFIERKISGWCGTPPVSYANYNGTWSWNGAEVRISVGYWGGIAEYQWQIISVDDKYLKVYRKKQEHKLDN